MPKKHAKGPPPPPDEPKFPPQPQIEYWMRRQGFTYVSLAKALDWAAWQDIQKIVKGDRRLRWDHVEEMARVLNVHPVRLAPLLGSLEDDVRLLEGTAGAALRSNAARYLVTNPVVEDGGIKMGDTITVVPGEPKHEQMVLVSITHEDRKRSFLMLYQFLAPNSIITYRRGFITGLRLNDPEFAIEVVGVVVDAVAANGAHEARR